MSSSDFANLVIINNSKCLWHWRYNNHAYRRRHRLYIDKNSRDVFDTKSTDKYSIYLYVGFDKTQSNTSSLTHQKSPYKSPPSFTERALLFTLQLS